MSFCPTVLGVVLGLGIALFANLFFLPMVLRNQVKQGVTTLPRPLDWPNIERTTRFVYRIVMPVFFATAFAILANQVFGGGLAP